MTSPLESNSEDDEDNESSEESNEFESGSSESSDVDGNDGVDDSELGLVSDNLFFIIGNRSKYGRPVRLNSKFI